MFSNEILRYIVFPTLFNVNLFQEWRFPLIVLSPSTKGKLLTTDLGRAAKILASDWLSTSISTFSWFELLSGSLEFDFLSRIVRAKNTSKSSATAIKDNPKSELIICVTRKNLIGFVWLKN